METAQVPGFGMVAGDVTDHFVVNIPHDDEGEVVIAERLCAPSHAEAPDTRVEVSRVMATLSLKRWLLIENEVRMEFNRRLRRSAWRRAIRIALIETPDSDRPPRPTTLPTAISPASKPAKEGLKSRKKRHDLETRLAQPSLPCLE